MTEPSSDPMTERSAADATSDNGNSTGDTDDWAAAIAEQSASRAAPPSAGPSIGPQGIFPDLSASQAPSTPANDLSMLMDIPVQLTVELGRIRIPIKHILQLAQGSVVELDALAGEPMDVLVNGCLIAQGEVVVVNDKFGVRLTDIVTPAERVRRLNRG